MTTPATAADQGFLAEVEAESGKQDLPVLLPPGYDQVGPDKLVHWTGPLDDQRPAAGQASESSEDTMETDDDCPDQTPWLRGRFRVPAANAERGAVVIACRAWLRNVEQDNRQAAEVLHTQLCAAGPEVARLVRAGLSIARLAQGGDAEAMQLMTVWFGPQPGNVPAGENWWRGVMLILRQIDRYLVHPMHLYYGGPEVKKNTPEYPAAGEVDWGQTESKETVNAVANCTSRARDLVVVLRKYGCTQTKLLLPVDGFSSIAGTLLHELTHNICGAEDHVFQSGRVASGVPEALMLARYVPGKAWYNAYNLEFFCEDAAGGNLTSAARDAALKQVEASHQQFLAGEQK